MLHDAGYDKITLFSATKGMNQNISREKITGDYSYYIKNILPDSLGEGSVRYGTSLYTDKPTDNIISAFSFTTESGSRQQVLYLYGYKPFTSVINLRIVSSNEIVLTSGVNGLFQLDENLKLAFRDKFGQYPPYIYEIKKIEPVPGYANTIKITVTDNSFADNLDLFLIDAPPSSQPEYISPNSFSISIPPGFITSLYYNVGDFVWLKVNGEDSEPLIISTIDSSVAGKLTFTVSLDDVPAFGPDDTVVLTYKSKTPEVISIYYASGYIKVYDEASDSILAGADQTIDGLNVACVPRSEYFDKVLFIYNGVDYVMTWNGTKLEVYEEEVKEQAKSFSRIDNTHFSFVVNPLVFEIEKYQNGAGINISVDGGTHYVIVSNVAIVGDLVTITTAGNIPVFTGANKIRLYYMDKPPEFSYMKAAHDRLWCLPPGAVSLSYRKPEDALRFYFSYTSIGNESRSFKFINEKTKQVPSVDISGKHGVADNLEAIVEHSGHLIFVGRKSSQIYRGADPLELNSQASFSWVSTLDVGVYHGDLVVDLPNDVWIATSHGFASFGTLNVARQFAVSSSANMDRVVKSYIQTIETNSQYRSCRAFKYKNGAFCGFKIGGNDIIVSKYDTSLYWWCVFGNDFTASTTFLTSVEGPLYLYIGNKVYVYSDGTNNKSPSFGDRDGTRLVEYIEVKHVNNINKRFANKRYDIDCKYSSSVIINKDNRVDVYITGDLSETFILQDEYKLPMKGDVLGSIKLVGDAGPDPNNPDPTKLGLRLNIPTRKIKGRLKFVSDIFSVAVFGSLKNGPFTVQRIRLLGIVER